MPLLLLVLAGIHQGCGAVDPGKEPTITRTPEGQEVERVPRFGDLALSDLDGDRRLDLVVVEERSAEDGPPPDGLVTVFMQQASGNFRQGVTYPAFKAARSVATGDLNSDGWQDVVVGSWQALTASMTDRLIFFLQPPGSGGALMDAGHLELSMRIWDLGVGDLNGDGHSDLVVAGSPSTMVLMNDPADPGVFLVRQIIDQQAERLALADIDGDGHLDLVLNRGSVDSSIRVYLNDDEMLVLHQELETGGEVNALAAADLNADGRVDLTVGNRLSDAAGDSLPGITTFLQKASPAEPGYFEEPDHTVTDDWRQRLPGGVAVADFDGDETPELAAIAGGEDVWDKEGIFPVVRSRTHIALLDRSAEGFVVRERPLIRENVVDLEVGDMNGDGLPDLVFSAYGVAILYNRTDRPGSFGAPVWIGRGNID
jgi:hypothetical protein